MDTNTRGPSRVVMFREHQWRKLKLALQNSRPNNEETLAYVVLEKFGYDDGAAYYRPHSYLAFQGSDLEIQSSSRVRVSGIGMSRLLQGLHECRRELGGRLFHILEIHTHPPQAGAFFSSLDDQSDLAWVRSGIREEFGYPDFLSMVLNYEMDQYCARMWERDSGPWSVTVSLW